MLSKLTFTPAVGSAIDIHAASGSYQVTRTEGIAGPPAPRDVLKVAPGRDGSLDDTRMISHRDIVIEGEIIGTSQTDVWTKWDALAAAFQSTLLSRGTLTVTLPDGTTQRQISVVLSGAAQPSFEGGSAYLQYQVNLRAPDPRWYGTTLNSVTLPSVSSVGGTSTLTNITNAGNAPSPITLVATNGSAETRWTPITLTVPTAYQTALGKTTQSVTFGTASTTQSGTLFGTVGLGLLATSQTLIPSGTLGTYSVTISATTRTLTSTSTYYRQALNANTDWLMAYPGAAGTQQASWTSVSFSGATSPSGATCQFQWRDAWW